MLLFQNIADISSEEEAGENENELKESEEPAVDPKEKAELISSGRILTDDEFRRIEAYQLSKKLLPAKGKKRKTVTFEDSERKSGLPRLSDIEKLYKKPREGKEARVASVKTGHTDREKFGRPKKKEHAGKTNKTNAKNKPFTMVKHRQSRKKKRSFHDKQVALKNYLLKKK